MKVVEHNGIQNGTRRRRRFLTTGIAFLTLAGGLSSPALSRRDEKAQGLENRSGGGKGRGEGGGGKGQGGGKGGGRRQQNAPGSGTGTGGAEKQENQGENCKRTSDAPIRLILNGKQAWEGPLTKFFEQPGAKKSKKGSRNDLMSLPLSALITNSKRRWKKVDLSACDGSRQSFDADSLVKTPDRFILVETRRKFMKLIEIQQENKERTLLRDIRTIEMQ
jgi:hypothetical protein